MLRCFPGKANVIVHRFSGKNPLALPKVHISAQLLFMLQDCMDARNVAWRNCTSLLTYGMLPITHQCWLGFILLFTDPVAWKESDQPEINWRLTPKNKNIRIYLVWSGNLSAEAHSAFTSISVVSLEMQGDKNVSLYTHTDICRCTSTYIFLYLYTDPVYSSKTTQNYHIQLTGRSILP